MKCQHCGINFDDDERECPICGARAGSKGRMSVPRYTDAQHKKHSKKTCTHQTFTRDVSFTGGKKTSAQGAEAKKKRGKNMLITVVAVFAALQILPAVITLIADAVSGVTAGFGTYEPAPEPDYGDYYDDTYDDSFGFYDLAGAHAAAELADGGVLELRLEPGLFGAYEMSITNTDGIYTEAGESWCSYNSPEESEGLYPEEFPAEVYDCFVVALTAETAGWAAGGGEMPAWQQVREENGDLWLLAYQDRTTNDVILVDWDETGIFAGEQMVMLHPLQEG